MNASFFLFLQVQPYSHSSLTAHNRTVSTCPLPQLCILFSSTDSHLFNPSDKASHTENAQRLKDSHSFPWSTGVNVFVCFLTGNVNFRVNLWRKVLTPLSYWVNLYFFTLTFNFHLIFVLFSSTFFTFSKWCHSPIIIIEYAIMKVCRERSPIERGVQTGEESCFLCGFNYIQKNQ